MLPKSVSRHFVLLASASVAIPICTTTLIFIPQSFMRKAAESLDGRVLAGISGSAASVLSTFLVLKAFSYFGVRLRGRFVERLQSAHRDEEEVAAELPILIRHNPWPVWIAAGVTFLFGLGMCLSLIGIPRLDPDTDATFAVALILMTIGLIVTAYKQPKLCEVSDQGIRAPAGYWNRLRFVPWDERVRCEINRDDESGACENFQTLGPATR